MSHERELARLEAENAALRKACEAVPRILYGIALDDPRQAMVAQKAIDACRSVLASAPTSADDGEGWVKCETRMPEEGEHVIAKVQYDDEPVRAHHRNGRWVESSSYIDADSGPYGNGAVLDHQEIVVTHWHPMPPTTGGEGAG